MKLFGKLDVRTFNAANNYVTSLRRLNRFEEAKSLLLKLIPVALRVLEHNHTTLLTLKWNYATALWMDAKATLDDLREAVATLEDIIRIARRVFGGEHPHTNQMMIDLKKSRAVLLIRENAQPPPGSA